ncbi:MAG: hypothetical protein KDA98_09700 [Acidimicrobiales bacterium]|nr:hypothetical protein [Acidimicrobiales bacterium]
MSSGGVRGATCRQCHSDDVARLYLGSVRLDSCACNECGATWDEDAASGELLARSPRTPAVG